MTGKRKITTQEYQRLHTYLKRRHRYRDLVMVSICYHTGYRIQEVLSLQVKDVFLDDGSIRKEIDIKSSKMKKKSPRISIPINEALREDLQTILYELKTNDRFAPSHFLIQSQKGKNKSISYTQAYRIVMDLFDACNITDNVAVHSFRKSFCHNIFKKSDKDIIATQKIMGHKDPMTTLKYLHVEKDRLHEVILS